MEVEIVLLLEPHAIAVVSLRDAGGVTVEETLLADKQVFRGVLVLDRVIKNFKSSPAAKTAELHETVDENGVMKMVHHPEGWEIPAGGTLELKPGGKHIMLIGLTAPLVAGEKIKVTLNFEKAGAQTIDVPVKAMSGM